MFVVIVLLVSLVDGSSATYAASSVDVESLLFTEESLVKLSVDDVLVVASSEVPAVVSFVLLSDSAVLLLVSTGAEESSLLFWDVFYESSVDAAAASASLPALASSAAYLSLSFYSANSFLLASHFALEIGSSIGVISSQLSG